MGDIPVDQLAGGDLIASLDPESWVYFLCNVGDGDSQLVVLPSIDGKRKVIVVDAYTDKVVRLITELTSRGVLNGQEPDIALGKRDQPRFMAV